MNEELKPCPFCGGENLTIYHSGNGMVGVTYHIRCNECNISVECAAHTKDEITEEWNKGGFLPKEEVEEKQNLLLRIEKLLVSIVTVLESIDGRLEGIYDNTFYNNESQ